MKIIIKNLQNRIPINPKRIKKAILEILASAGVKKSGEITVCLVNDKQIKKLNLRYLAHNAPTDVISFDLSDKKAGVLADIAISTDTAIRNAEVFKTTPLFELSLYLVHGILHLLGYDDKTAKQRRRMERKTKYILARLKIKRARLK